jgi:hypothetical protein
MLSRDHCLRLPAYGAIVVIYWHMLSMERGMPNLLDFVPRLHPFNDCLTNRSLGQRASVDCSARQEDSIGCRLYAFAGLVHWQVRLKRGAEENG